MLQLFQTYHKIGVTSAVVYFHHVKVGCVADILDEHAAFIFRPERDTVSECSLYTAWWWICNQSKPKEILNRNLTKTIHSSFSACSFKTPGT
jgi:hypothetical protein